MLRRRHDVSHDRKPRLPPSASTEEIASRARGEALFARVSAVLLLPVVVATAVSLFHDFDFALVARSLARDEASVDPERIMALDARADTVVYLPLVASIPFTIAFLLWLHRAFYNAHWMGGGRWMRFSPGQAIGSFFVPFRNLFRPLQAFHELASCSEPHDLDEPPRAPDSTAGYREPALAPAESVRTFPAAPLATWWATWIGAHVVGCVGTRLAHSMDLQVAATGGWVLVASDALELAAAVCVGLVVHRLDRRRQEVLRRLGALAISVTPGGGLDDEAPRAQGHA